MATSQDNKWYLFLVSAHGNQRIGKEFKNELDAQQQALEYVRENDGSFLGCTNVHLHGIRWTDDPENPEFMLGKSLAGHTFLIAPFPKVS